MSGRSNGCQWRRQVEYNICRPSIESAIDDRLKPTMECHFPKTGAVREHLWRSWDDVRRHNNRFKVATVFECSVLPISGHSRYSNKQTQININYLRIVSKDISPDGIDCTIGTYFKGNATIVNLNSLRYFTGIASMSSQAFQGCSALQYAYIPPKVKSIEQTFTNCSSLKKVVFPTNFNYIGYMSINCYGTNTILDFTTLSSITNFALYHGTYIIVIRQSTTPPSFNLRNGIDTCIAKAYVPDEAVDTYKAHASWSSIASKIYPLSAFVE